MKKKYLHEYTLRELLVEEEEPEEKKSWLDDDNPWVPNFIETPVKDWIKKKLKSTAATASRIERENDEMLIELRKKYKCWDFLVREYDVTVANTWYWPHDACPWFKEHIENNKVKFANLLAHVVLMDSENKTEFDNRIRDLSQVISQMTADTAGGFGDLDALLALGTEVQKAISFTSDTVTSAAGTSAKAAVIMKIFSALIPKDIDRVNDQLEVLFAGQGGVPKGLSREATGTTQPLMDEMKRLWFYEYEKYVLKTLLADQTALPQSPTKHFNGWMRAQYHEKEEEELPTEKQEG